MFFVIVFRIKSCRVSVGVFSAKTAVMELDNFAYDVVSKPPSANLESILPAARRNAFQLFDVMLPCLVIGIGSKDRRRAFLRRIEIAVGFVQLVGKPIVVRGGSDAKGRGRRHARERRRAGFAVCRARFAKSSSMGRLLPARNSS